MKTEMNSNKHSYVELKEVSFSRIVDFHSKNGYAIVSASRGENTDAENKKLDKQLKADISFAGWTFTPIYGGFVETNKERHFWIHFSLYQKLDEFLKLITHVQVTVIT